MPGLIQDALDSIEYAIGPVTSKWGAVRAKNGHPAPFPAQVHRDRQRAARRASTASGSRSSTRRSRRSIRSCKIALSSWIAGIDQRIIDAAGKIDIVDEHAYKALHWAIENFDSFASYKRQGWDLYIGEFATNAGVGRGNVLAMLNDAAYMMSMEKNTDLVKMGSYAPLLENVNDRDWPVNMIHFDSSRAYARATYYAEQAVRRESADGQPRHRGRSPAALPRNRSPRGSASARTTPLPSSRTSSSSATGRRALSRPTSATASGWTPEGRRGKWGVVRRRVSAG